MENLRPLLEGSLELLMGRGELRCLFRDLLSPDSNCFDREFLLLSRLAFSLARYVFGEGMSKSRLVSGGGEGVESVSPVDISSNCTIQKHASIWLHTQNVRSVQYTHEPCRRTYTLEKYNTITCTCIGMVKKGVIKEDYVVWGTPTNDVISVATHTSLQKCVVNTHNHYKQVSSMLLLLALQLASAVSEACSRLMTCSFRVRRRLEDFILSSSSLSAAASCIATTHSNHHGISPSTWD